jgi:hypothetical protein
MTLPVRSCTTSVARRFISPRENSLATLARRLATGGWINRPTDCSHEPRACRAGAEGEEMTGPAERYRQNADDCRQRSLQARLPVDKANWLKIAEEWQKLAEEVDPAELKGRAHS